MKETIKIVYQLRTSKEQYAYLLHEIRKTKQMYEDLYQQKKRCQGSFDEEMMVKGYAKRYVAAMSRLEKKWIVQCLKQQHHSFVCGQVIDDSYRWRSINLYPMLWMPYDWMRRPMYEHWIIKQSYLYQDRGQLNLALVFEQPDKNMV